MPNQLILNKTNILTRFFFNKKNLKYTGNKLVVLRLFRTAKLRDLRTNSNFRSLSLLSKVYNFKNT